MFQTLRGGGNNVWQQHWTEEDVDLNIRIPLIPALWSTNLQPLERSVCQLHLSTALNYRHFELAHKVNVFMFEAAPYVLCE